LTGVLHMGDSPTMPTAPRKAPPLALTMGDAAGIGPECIIKAWQAGALHQAVVLTFWLALWASSWANWWGNRWS
jgi:hypothetical protein